MEWPAIVHGMLELRFADTLGDPGHPAGADAAAQAHDAGVEGLWADPLGPAPLPMLQLVGAQGMAVDRRQDLGQRHGVPVRQERLQWFLRAGWKISDRMTLPA